MLRRPSRRAALAWTSRRIRRHGVPFMIAVRFLPSGRIAGALASGVLHYPLRKYLIGAGLAESLWATYSVGLGYLGSAAANPFYAAAIGIGVSVLVAAAGTAVQWVVHRRALRARAARRAPGNPPCADRGEGGDQASSITAA
ncbi:DedA family protein [Streptomyces noursei]|uniref:DedA family protein n=1 Tax=Streptomyces noursei TaxID=1971 RepID=UPI0023B7DCAC|nr:VTT domain-containing protein [Streptomyces noursei]